MAMTDETQNQAGTVQPPADTTGAQTQSAPTPAAAPSTTPAPVAETPTPAASSSAPTTDTPEVAPAPLGDNSGTGAPNAISATSADATKDVINQALGDNPTEEQTTKVRQVLGDAGVSPTPETVNGVSVVGKKLSDDGESWVDDPDYEAASGRGQDVFDRIGIASPNEGVRQVLEEIARFVGMTSENTLQLPDGMPNIKSTASLRKDVGAAAPVSAPTGSASQTPASTTSPANAADGSGTGSSTASTSSAKKSASKKSAK